MQKNARCEPSRRIFPHELHFQSASIARSLPLRCQWKPVIREERFESYKISSWALRPLCYLKYVKTTNTVETNAKAYIERL